MKGRAIREYHQSHDGKVLRNPPAHFGRYFHGAECHLVIAGEDGVQVRAPLQQWTDARVHRPLLAANIRIDGRGRGFDNIFIERLWRTVKYEDLYIKDYLTVLDLDLGLLTSFHLSTAPSYPTCCRGRHGRFARARADLLNTTNGSITTGSRRQAPKLRPARLYRPWISALIRE